MVDKVLLGLAPKVVEKICERLVEVAAQALAPLIVEQNVTQSFQVAEPAYVLERGLALEGCTSELATDPPVARIYLGETHV